MKNLIASVEIGKVFTDNEKLKEPLFVNDFVTAIVSGAISISGVVLLFLLIGGGIAMIAGAGKSDPQTVEKGKKAATSALIGFIVVFSAYWIVKLIESITGLTLIGIGIK